VGKPYLAPGGRHYGCRHCHDLTDTRCQERGKGDRLFAMMAAEMGCIPQDIKRAMRRREKR
jgi:hypothetical protein